MPPCLKFIATSHVLFKVIEYIEVFNTLELNSETLIKASGNPTKIFNTLKTTSSILNMVSEKVKIDCS